MSVVQVSTSAVQPTPSVLFVVVQPPVPLQATDAWHSVGAGHEYSTPTHWPFPSQVSALVHALLSLQPVPTGWRVNVHAPVPSQAADTSHWPGVQAYVVPLHAPEPSHWSVFVQATPSSQSAPAPLLAAMHPPVPSQLTACWHWVGAGHAYVVPPQ